MSFREEDRQKIGCPSRGFGLAAAAIGVGVGAALYYFFSKRPENPHGEGATDSGWRSEPLYYEGGNTEREQLRTYRDRPWTNEECSICFELITLNQEVMVLPCTHRFHQACILPWLQEKETCPNCRRRAD